MITLTTKGARGLARQIRARFTKGKIEPLEEVDFKEGDEVIITLKETPSPATAQGAFERAAGGWKGTWILTPTSKISTLAGECSLPKSPYNLPGQYH
jgi:predicted DNA-binding antitoxin AbrB/MazE fold protein